MSKTSAAQQRFESARERLAEALKTLECVMISKIHETAIAAKMSSTDNNDPAMLAKVFEQETTITNLQQEINKIQKAMEEIGKENEFQKEKNSFFADKMFKFKSQGSNLIQAIENDLVRIQEIIKE